MANFFCGVLVGLEDSTPPETCFENSRWLHSCANVFIVAQDMSGEIGGWRPPLRFPKVAQTFGPLKYRKMLRFLQCCANNPIVAQVFLKENSTTDNTEGHGSEKARFLNRRTRRSQSEENRSYCEIPFRCRRDTPRSCKLIHSCANLQAPEMLKKVLFPPMSRKNPIVAQTRSSSITPC